MYALRQTPRTSSRLNILICFKVRLKSLCPHDLPRFQQHECCIATRHHMCIVCTSSVAQAEPRTSMQSTASLSASMKNMRAQMESSDDELGAFMSSLRGSNLNDDDFAAEGQQVELMSVTGNMQEADAQLPLSYDPEAIYNFWSVRPVSVINRIVQLGWISSNFIGGLLWDTVTGSVKKHEVRRAIQVRLIISDMRCNISMRTQHAG